MKILQYPAAHHGKILMRGHISNRPDRAGFFKARAAAGREL